MKNIKIICTSFLLFTSFAVLAQSGRFNMEKDLLLAHYDCKTDVDDLHSAAALATLMTHPDYQDLQYHAVAGAYGVQEGLYVPPNDLFQMAFGNHWSDAHDDWDKAVQEVLAKAKNTLRSGGNIWIADAGQSDFSASLVREIVKDMKDLDPNQRIHIVQHSDWNEEVTSETDLNYVKATIDYIKIDDGNAEGNGTPGFRTPEFHNWNDHISDPHLQNVWELAVKLGNRYNGKEGRYLNEAVQAGGLDFSDMSEVCWILGLEDIPNTNAFFEMFGE